MLAQHIVALHQDMFALHEDIRVKTAGILEKYHALHVYPLEIRVRWAYEPWYRKVWMILTRTKPDFAALEAEALAKFDATQCEVRGDGDVQCIDEKGHAGPHRIPAPVRIEGGREFIEWREPAA